MPDAVSPSSTARRSWFLPWLTGAWGLVAIVAIVYTLADVAWTYFKWGGPGPATLINDLVALPPSLLVTAAAWRAAASAARGSRLRRAWFLLGLGLLAYFVGNVIWAYLVDVAHIRPFPSLADVFYLAFYPCVFASVWFFGQSQPDRRKRLLAWLDLLSVFAAAAIFVGYFIVVPTASASQRDLLTQAVAVAHAIGSLMLIGAIGAVLLRRPLPGVQDSLVFFLVGMTVFLASDFAFGYTGLAGTYAEGGWVDAGWNVAQLLFLLAAVRYLHRTLASTAAPRWRTALARLTPVVPLVVIGASYALVIYVIVAQFGPAAEWLLAGALLLTALLIARGALTPGFGNLSIRYKVLLSLLVAVTFSVSLVTLTSYLTLRSRLESAVGATLKVQAEAEAESIANQVTKQHDIMEGFILSYVMHDAAIAANESYPPDPTVVQAILQRRDAAWQTAGPSDPLVSSVLNNELAGHLRDFLANFPRQTEALVTDKYGATLAASTRPAHYYHADIAWWRAAYNGGQGAIYIAGPTVNPFGGLRLVLAQPVRAGLDGQVVGVMWLTYSIQDVVTLLAGDSGPDAEYDLLLPGGQMLTPSGALRSVDPAALARLSATAQADDAQLNLSGSVQLVSQAPVTTDDADAAAAITNLNWTVVSRQAPSAAFAPEMAAGQTALLTTLIVLLLTAGLAVLLSRLLVAPLARLTHVADQIATGDLSTRVQVESRDEIGTLGGAFNTMLDALHANINQLNRAQQALQESERRYRRLVDYFPDLVAVFGQGQTLFINPAGEKLLGVNSAVDLARLSLLDLVLPEDRELAERGLARDHAGGEASPLLEWKLRRPDGTTFDAEFRAIPITYGGQAAVQAVIRDVTERKRAEEQVRQSAARAEALARVASIVNARLDLSGVSQAICDEAARALSVPVVTLWFMTENQGQLELAQQVGLPLESLPAFRKMADAYIGVLTQHPGPVLAVPDLRGSTEVGPAGLFGPLDLRTLLAANMFHNGQIVGVLVVMTRDEPRVFSADELALLKGLADQAALALSNARLFAEVEQQRGELEVRVTQRTEQLNALNGQLQAELSQRQELVQTLSESEQRFRLLFDASPEAIFLIDPHDAAAIWPIVDCNQAACQMNGYTRAELIGQPIDLLNVKKTTPAEFAQVLEDMRRGGALHSVEAVHIRKDGYSFPIEYATVVISIGERELVLGIDHDITERKQAEIALKKAMELAEAASRAKSEFLSRMSHELRTPMNAVLGFGQLLTLSRKDPLTPGQRERVQQIVKGGQHLLDLINEILDLSRIEAGRLQISPEPVRVMDALREVLELTAPLAASGDIEVHASLVADANPYVLADRQRLKQILLNLLSNAIKYNHERGQVTVTCQQVHAGYWRLGVIDTGPGIAPESLERLFIPFERLAADQSPVEGTGLGLALAKRLTELMQGTIGVDSVVGEGSTFWFELPAAESHLERLQRTGGTGPLPSLPPNARSVLYIEDNPGNYELVRQVLGDYAQIELLWATEAEAGLDLAKRRVPDLVLLDLHLGASDGAEVLRQMKQDALTAAIPVVVVSADATSGQEERLRTLGAVAYLTKPLNVKQFVGLIEELLGQPGG